MGKYKGWIALGVVAFVAFMAWSWYTGTYNGMVQSQNQVQEGIGNLQSAYQSRNDKTGQLVGSVKGAVKQNQVFVDIAAARSGIGKFANIDPATLASNPTLMQEYLAAQAAMSRATSGSQFRIVTEAYPELKTNENFLQLQSQIEGMDNRIATARRDYNAFVRDYNTRVQSFLGRFVAGSKFLPMPYYQATSAGVETAPTVSFDETTSTKP